MACKPGSVRHGQAMADDHSSGTPVTGRLMQPTRAATRKQVPSRNARVPPLFGFAPGGVCRAASVAGRAVRSYRTLSPLPAAADADRRAVYFLWHFPWGRPRRTLSGTVFPWSPDFPLPFLRKTAAIRPSDLYQVRRRTPFVEPCRHPIAHRPAHGIFSAIAFLRSAMMSTPRSVMEPPSPMRQVTSSPHKLTPNNTPKSGANSVSGATCDTSYRCSR